MLNAPAFFPVALLSLSLLRWRIDSCGLKQGVFGSCRIWMPGPGISHTQRHLGLWQTLALHCLQLRGSLRWCQVKLPPARQSPCWSLCANCFPTWYEKSTLATVGRVWPPYIILVLFCIAPVKLSRTRNYSTSKTCTSKCKFTFSGLWCPMLKYLLIRKKYSSGDLLNLFYELWEKWTIPGARSVFYYTCSWLPTNSLVNLSDTSCMDIYRKTTKCYICTRWNVVSWTKWTGLVSAVILFHIPSKATVKQDYTMFPALYALWS